MKLSNFGIECASSIVRSWFLTISCSLWRVCPDSIIKDSKTLKSDLSPLKFLSSWALLDLNIPIVSSARCRRFLKLSSFMILFSILFRLMGGHKEYCGFTRDHLIYGIRGLFRPQEPLWYLIKRISWGEWLISRRLTTLEMCCVGSWKQR